MTNETMTIHEGLAELKTLENRIERAVDKGIYCAANRCSNDKIAGVSVKEYESIIQGSYDKATNFIKRYIAIKRAITLSNAVTRVDVAGEIYTVAEAIYMKNSGMDFYTRLLTELRHQYNLSQAEILDNNGKKLEQKADDYIINMFGSKEGKTSSDELDKAKSAYIRNYSYTLIDPIKIRGKIEELEEYISKFNAKIDSALSVSNAVTVIEIEY